MTELVIEPDDRPPTGAATAKPRARRASTGRAPGRPAKARGQPNSSDAASARWTVRGVPPQVREMALKAAEGRNMTVGDWLAETIVGAVRGQAKLEVAAPPRVNLPAVETPQDLLSMLHVMDERLSRLERQPPPPPRGMGGFLGKLFGRRQSPATTALVPTRKR